MSCHSDSTSCQGGDDHPQGSLCEQLHHVHHWTARPGCLVIATALAAKEEMTIPNAACVSNCTICTMKQLDQKVLS